MKLNKCFRKKGNRVFGDVELNSLIQGDISNILLCIVLSFEKEENINYIIYEKDEEGRLNFKD